MLAKNPQVKKTDKVLYTSTLEKLSRYFGSFRCDWQEDFKDEVR